MSDREATIRHYWLDVIGANRFELAGEVYAPQFRVNDDAETPEGWAEGMRSWQSHFAETSAELLDLVEAGDKVITRVVLRGRHIEDFRSFRAHDRRFEVLGLDIFEFSGDRVAQHWHLNDHWELFQQLGAKLVDGVDEGSSANS